MGYARPRSTSFFGVDLVKKLRAYRKEQNTISVTFLKETFQQALSLLQGFHERFIVPDSFMKKHPEREQMVQYLKAKSWRGNDTGAAMSAGVSLAKVREWRKHEEFCEWEEMADQACTDLVEEAFLFHGLGTGDQQTLSRVLEARSARYTKRQEITGKGGGPITFEVKLGDVPRPKKLD